VNRRGLSFAPLLAACIVSPAAADTVTCANGSRYTGVIAGETDTHLVLRVGGAELFLSRSSIVSVRKDSPEEDRRLAEEWQTRDARYKDESAQAESNPPPPGPAPSPTPVSNEQPEEETGPETGPFVFPAQPPFSGPAAPPSPDPVAERLSRERAVRAAIRRKEVLPGMTPREVRDAWGWPDLTHPVHGVGVYTDRWIYTRDGARTIVYFNRGTVTRVEP